MNKIIILLMVIFTFVLGSCASANLPAINNAEEPFYSEAAPAAPPPPGDMAVKEMDQDLMVRQSQSGDDGSDRIVIKNAGLSIVVEDPSMTMEKISQMAEETGGFVVSSNLYKVAKEGGIEVPEGNITIRVPAEILDQTLTEIKTLVANPAEDVLSENVSGEDVTREYTDLESRLRNLEDTEAQLKEILDQARTTEDVMTVFNQLTSVREQIEIIKGQIQYYDESARLSAISIRILASEGIQPLTIGKWQPFGIALDALQALIKALKFLVNSLIWMILFFLPIALLIFLPIWLIWKAVRSLYKKRKNRQAAIPEIETPEKIEE